MKITEYMSCGKVVVGSNFGNLMKMIPQKTLLVNEQNVQNVVKVLSKLVKNKRLREKIGKDNRKKVMKHYDWDVVNRKILRALPS